MKSVVFVLVVVGLLASAALADSSYFNCECFYGTVASTATSTSCTCDCTGATNSAGVEVIAPYCAYGASEAVQLSVATTETNTSEFSGTTLELQLQKLFGVPGDVSAIRYSKIDDTSRGITQHFAPRLIAIFAIGSGTLASTMINMAKDTAQYDANLAPLGVLEIEVFYLSAGPTSGLAEPMNQISAVWIVMPVIAVLIALIECCFAKSAKERTFKEAEAEEEKSKDE